MTPVCMRIAINPLPGDYDYVHLLQMYKYIFRDMYEWAGRQRKLNIYKEEPVRGGFSVNYSDVLDIPRDAECALSEMKGKPWADMDTHEAAIQFSDSLAELWRVYPFREGNTRTTVTFCCQYADGVGLKPNRELLEDNAQCVCRW